MLLVFFFFQLHDVACYLFIFYACFCQFRDIASGLFILLLALLSCMVLHAIRLFTYYACFFPLHDIVCYLFIHLLCLLFSVA